MAATVRDWQLHGITLKVELATSGSLVVGGNQTDYALNPGGEYGCPTGWDAGEYFSGNNGNESLYNWTTSAGIFSVSAKTTPVNARSAGIWGLNSLWFPMQKGYRYQIGCQARQMAGKSSSTRSVTLERSTNGGTSFSYYTGSQGLPAQSDWEGILATGSTVTQDNAIGRINLLGGPPTSQLVMWGTQFQNLFIKQLDLAPEPTVWTDITCDVKSIGIRYGRERFTNRYDVATMQLDLLNTSGVYSFHEPHPLGLAPGRQVRVTATYKGVEYPMAFHILDSMVDAYDMDGLVISRWSCVDPTTVLGNVNVKTNQGIWPRGASERIGLLLDQVGYIPRLLDANSGWFFQPISGSGRTVRDECGLTSDSEGGQFFADRQGNCVYKNRDWQNTDTHINQVTADLVAYPAGEAVPVVDQVPTWPNAPMVQVRELATGWSLDRLINLVSLANAGGNAQEFMDEDSFKRYGPATYQRHDFVMSDDSHLATRAADIMTGYTEPKLRVNQVSFAPGQSVAWEWTLGVFLNWLVRVWYTHPLNYWGYAFTVHIQSIEHRITPTDWETTMAVDLPLSFTELEWLFVNGWDHQEWDNSLWDQGDEVAGSLWDTGATWSNPTSKWGI